MGGRLTARSDGPGTGATFRLEIGLAATAIATATPLRLEAA